MATLNNRKKQKLISPDDGFQQGGFSIDMFDGLYNLGTKRGRRRQRRLERQIGRANDGSRRANRQLQEQQIKVSTLN